MPGAGLRGSVVAHVQTWRPYTLWYVGLLGLAGAGLATGPRSWPVLLAAWGAPTLAWLGGHYLGDWFDRDLDAAAKPHRPIPSGRLPARTALACGVGCMVAVTVLAATGGPFTLGVALAAAAGIVGYSRWLKAHGLAGNLVRGVLGALVVVYGAATVGDAPAAVLLAFAVAFCTHDAASNLVGTLRDVDGDRAGGYRTVPVRHGPGVARLVAGAFYAVALLGGALGGTLVLAAGTAGPGAAVGYPVMLAVTAGFGLAAFTGLVRDRHACRAAVALRAHELLVYSRVTFAGAVLGLGFGLVAALAVTVPALGLTWLLQRTMRTTHEFGDDRETTGPSERSHP